MLAVFKGRILAVPGFQITLPEYVVCPNIILSVDVLAVGIGEEGQSLAGALFPNLCHFPMCWAKSKGLTESVSYVGVGFLVVYCRDLGL